MRHPLGGARSPRSIDAPTRVAFATAALLAAVAGPLDAQQVEAFCAGGRSIAVVDLDDPFGDYARLAEIAGRAPSRPRVIRQPADERHAPVCVEGDATPWDARLGATLPEIAIGDARLRFLPVAALAQYNTGYPRDRNDGVRWSGRGLSTEVRGGIELAWGPVSAAFAPVAVWQQNRAFEIVPLDAADGRSPYRYPWHLIDWPQRFGDASFGTLDLGGSYIRVDAYGAAFGFSTENLWWGPARRNPILMSNSGPGFPHVFLGTGRPVDIRIGRLEGRLLWGHLAESDYFDDNPDNDRRLIAGVVVDFEPRGLPGLYLGGARAYLRTIPPGGLDLGDYILGPYTDVRLNPRGTDNPEADNQLLSLFARWALPESGFEAYVEWAREDHFADIEDFTLEPDHSQGYTIGLQKVVEAGPRWIRLAGEIAHLGASTTIRSGRALPPFYTHSQVIQGYTHRGQLIGAGIGPGADAQFLGADLFTSRGVVGVYGERIRYDNDAYYQWWANIHGFRGHDVEVTAGVRQLLFLGDFDLSWELSFSHRYNRNFVRLSDPEGALWADRNWGFRLGAAWRPGAASRSTTPLPVTTTGR